MIKVIFLMIVWIPSDNYFSVERYYNESECLDIKTSVENTFLQKQKDPVVICKRVNIKNNNFQFVDVE